MPYIAGRKLNNYEIFESVEQVLNAMRIRTEIFTERKEGYTCLYEIVNERNNTEKEIADEETKNRLKEYEELFKEQMEVYSDPVDLAKLTTFNLVEKRLNDLKLRLADAKAGKKRLQGRYYYRVKKKGLSELELLDEKFSIENKMTQIKMIEDIIKSVEKELAMVQEAAMMFKLGTCK